MLCQMKNDFELTIEVKEEQYYNNVVVCSFGIKAVRR